LAGIDDHRREPRLTRRGARGQIAAEAAAEQRDPLRVDPGALRHGIDQRRDHRFPVGAHDDPLLIQRPALSRPVEG